MLKKSKFWASTAAPSLKQKQKTNSYRFCQNMPKYKI